MLFTFNIDKIIEKLLNPEDDKNIDCYLELYQYGVNDPKRVNLSRYN